MAKILILSESQLGMDDNPFSVATTGLTENLLQQGHEVLFLCSPSQMGDKDPNYQHKNLLILSGFKKWNWLEFPQLISLIAYHKPDIIHIIQPHGPTLRRRLTLLDLVAQASPISAKTPLALSIMDLNLAEEHPQSIEKLLRFCDPVLVNNHMDESELIQKFRANPHKLAVTQPVPSRRMFHALPAPPELESLTPFLYIPGDLVDHDEPLLLSLLEELLQQAHYTVIIGGGWGQMPWKRRRQWHHRLISQDLGENIRITGHLSYAEHLFYMTQAQATQLMTLKSSCLMTALLRFLQDYLVGSSVDSFLPHRVPKDFPEQWISRVRQSMSTLRIVPNPDHHLFDQAGNQIQRIYQKILSRSVHG